jgi:hypothetical protein
MKKQEVLFLINNLLYLYFESLSFLYGLRNDFTSKLIIVDLLQILGITVKDLLNPQFYIEHGGLWMILFIVFAETGLFAGFFLPGDALLFVTGIFSDKIVSVALFPTGTQWADLSIGLEEKAALFFLKEKILFCLRKNIWCRPMNFMKKMVEGQFC